MNSLIGPRGFKTETGRAISFSRDRARRRALARLRLRRIKLHLALNLAGLAVSGLLILLGIL